MACCAVIAATPAFAQPEYSLITRRVGSSPDIGHDPGWFDRTYAYSQFPFETSSEARQLSNLSLTGAAFQLSCGGTSSTSTELIVTIYLEEATPYWIDVTLGFGGGPGSPGSGYGSFRLTGADININRTAGWMTDNRIQQSGLLVGGSYQLRVSADSSGGYQQSHWWPGSGSAVGFLQLGVPAPSSGALLGIAAVACLRRRR